METKHLPPSLAIVSLSVIAFQLVIMQLLSVMQWHHFAYMVISMAMLGFGAAGTVLSVARAWLQRRYPIMLPLLLVLTGVGMAVSVRVSTGVAGFDTYLLFFDTGQIGRLALTYVAFSLPFFTAGLAITLAFTCEVHRIGRLYFANLVGSGIGAVTVIILLSLIPLEYLVPTISLLPLIAAYLLRPRGGGPVPRVWVQVGLFFVCLLVIMRAFLVPISVEASQYKDISAALQLPGAEVVHRSDGPHGRLEVVAADAQRIALGLSLLSPQELPVRDVVFVNGDYFGALLGYPPNSQDHLLDETTRGLPYELRAPRRVLVMGSATGVDVSHALSRGADNVTAVEENRQAVRLLRDTRPDWIDGLYLDPRVQVLQETPRTYLSRNPEARYGLIVTPVHGAFGGEAGVESLAEAHTLTVEAFLAMWGRLEEDGMITTTVWVDSPPRGVLRLLATWREVLERSGVTDATQHIAAVRSWATITLVLSRSPLEDSEVDAAGTFATGLGFDPLLLPEIDPSERDRFNRLPNRELFALSDAIVAGDDPESTYRDYLFAIRPVSDDRPYFSRYLRPERVPELIEIYGASTVPYLEPGTVLAAVTLVQTVLAAVLLVVVPLVRIRWDAQGRRWTFLTFAGLGIGFMFFEIVLIQHLVLYLGQPIYATAAVLAVLLISSGAGSLLSGRLDGSSQAMLSVGLIVAATIGAYIPTLLPIIRSTIAWPFIAKTVIVLLLAAVPAFFMGMMFPLGLRRLAGVDTSHLPWACAIDSALSVSATAGATLVAVAGGYRLVLGISALAYASAALASIRLGAVNSD